MSLFNKFYSETNRQGYNPDNKPRTREELMKLILKDHFFNLIPLNAIYLIIFLPLCFWAITGAFYMTDALHAGGTFEDFLSLSQTWVLIMVPCILPTGPFLAAMAIVMRNLARDDYRLPKSTFFAALRENWKPALILSSVTSLVPILLWAALSVYGPLSNQLSSIFLLLTFVVCTIWLLTLPTLYTMIGTYQQSLFHQIKNALALTFSHLPLIIGMHLLLLLPVFVTLLGVMIGGKVLIVALFITTLFYLLCGFALSHLFYAFIANKLCETNLNRLIGADTHIGMASEDDD